MYNELCTHILNLSNIQVLMKRENSYHIYAIFTMILTLFIILLFNMTYYSTLTFCHIGGIKPKI